MLPSASLMKRSPASSTRCSYQGALRYTSGSGSLRSCTRAVNSLMNAVSSGSNTMVGGTVVARRRGLNAVELIQYSGSR